VTPAETLHIAAGLLQERAAAATPGPWTETTQSIRYGGLVGPPSTRRPEDDGYGGALVGESILGADRDYLRCVHPEVATHLAVLLDAIGVAFDPVPADALAVAEAVVRGVQ
jgi:hypothetical protein